MKLTENLAAAIADQITLELQSSIVYLQLGIELDAQDFNGMAAWMRTQAEEEQAHAAKFITHAIDRGTTPKIGAIEAPIVLGKTPVEMFQAALAHEEKVSNAIRALYRTAQEEQDLDSIPLLNWFISEQLEEEATVGNIVSQLRLVGNDGTGLLRIDAELSAREPSITVESS